MTSRAAGSPTSGTPSATPVIRRSPGSRRSTRERPSASSKRICADDSDPESDPEAAAPEPVPQAVDQLEERLLLRHREVVEEGPDDTDSVLVAGAGLLQALVGELQEEGAPVARMRPPDHQAVLLQGVHQRRHLAGAQAQMVADGAHGVGALA